MMSSAQPSGDMAVWGRGQQGPGATQTSMDPQVGFVTPKRLVKDAVWVGRCRLDEKPEEEVCAAGVSLRLAGRPESSALTALQTLSGLIPEECGATAGSQRPHHCPPGVGAGVWAQAPAPPSELLVNQLLVLVRLQLELLGGDLAILVAVLVLEHVAYGFL